MADPTGKLEAFIAALAKARADVSSQTAVVATRTSALEEARTAAETALSELRGEIDDADDEVGGAADDAEQALEDLEASAGKLANARLDEVAETIRGESDGFVRQAAEGATRLREATADAESDGFKAAQEGIKKAEDTVDEAKSALDRAFGQLALKIEQVGGQFADAVGAAAEKADDAAGESKQDADEVKAKADEVVATLTQYVSAAPSVFGDLTQQVSTFFESLGERVTTQGDQLVSTVEEALKALHAAVSAECTPSLGAAFDILVDECLPAATTEVEAWVETVFTAQGAAGDFAAATDELRNAKTTAKTISDILEKSLEE
jgi:chromosome segregation ATPase